MLIPTVTFLALMLTLIGCGFFVEGNEHSEPMHLLVEFFLFIYFAFTALLNGVFIVVTIRTWRTVYDNIHVRG